MTRKRKLTVYLAGGMEHEEDLGSDWREWITPILEKLGLEVLNPCEFEQEQLKGLHTNRLPEKLKIEPGSNPPKELMIDKDHIKPTHWHHLKYAEWDSPEFNRGGKYMDRVVTYDCNLVKNHVDFMIVNWTKGTAKGAGTHSEATIAHDKGIPIWTVVKRGVDIPFWTVGCGYKKGKLFRDFKKLVGFLEDEFGD